MKTYIAYVFKDPDRSFGVSFPDLPGCYGAGESYDEALENAKLSLREYALALAEDGSDMPKPRTHGELAGDTKEAIELKDAAFVAEVPLIVLGGRRRVNVSIDDRVLAAIDRACALAGVNRSAFLSEVATTWIKDKMGAVFAEPTKKSRRNKSKALAHA